MIRNVFVLGRTGSGKSTTVRLLTEEVEQYGCSVVPFNNYLILREMFVADGGKRFRPTEHHGFEVLDPSVFEEAFLRLQRKIEDFQPLSAKTLITIEFASNNYFAALKLFGNEFLQNSKYLFLLVDLATCLKRVDRRTIYPECQDDYYVSDSVLLQYFPCPYMPPIINHEQVSRIPNMGNLNELREHIRLVLPDLLQERMQTSPELVLSSVI